MSTFIDLLAITQEEAIMQNLSQRLAVPYAQIDPKYFTFAYSQLDDVRVSVAITGRVVSTNGDKSPWQATRSITFQRAQLRGLASVRNLEVNWVPGMAMEHILRALKLLHSFNVSIAELEFLNATGQWVQLAESYRPTVKTLSVRFSQAQGRIVPSTSQFTIILSPTVRNDVGEYLRIIAAGTVTGTLTP